MKKMLISFPDEIADRLKNEVAQGQWSEFVAASTSRGLDELGLRSLDEAIADIANRDKDLLDRLGDVQ